jgi:hypothetical protein
MSDENCCGACGYPIHATKDRACDWCRQSADRIEALTAERERLALAICGGEDAPGYANAQTVETLEKVARDNANATMAQINRTLAVEAKLAKAVEALRAVDALDPEGMIDGCSQAALRGLVLRMGDISRATLAEIEGEKG